MFKTKPKRVYVLGAGPAGLLAAQAAGMKGYEVTVFSRPRPDGKVAKSELYGCQYLHAFIPGVGITDDSWQPVRYTIEGDVVGYRRKVYGDRWNGSVSPDEYGPEQDHRAWDLRKAYDNLWDMWQESLVAAELGPTGIAETLFYDTHAYVLSTVPASAVCRYPDNHRFVTQDVYAMGNAGKSPMSRSQAPTATLPFVAPENTVVCNGNRDTRWYRAATVFGYSTLEWPGGKRPPISGVVPVRKPLSTDCVCWQSKRWHRLGRYGKWQKGVLVHTAYTEALKVLP